MFGSCSFSLSGLFLRLVVFLFIYSYFECSTLCQHIDMGSIGSALLRFSQLSPAMMITSALAIAASTTDKCPSRWQKAKAIDWYFMLEFCVRLSTKILLYIWFDSTYSHLQRVNARTAERKSAAVSHDIQKLWDARWKYTFHCLFSTRPTWKFSSILRCSFCVSLSSLSNRFSCFHHSTLDRW